MLVKKVLAILLAALGLALTAPAQVSLEVTLQQEQFLSGEAIPLAVRITNRSGRTLTMGNQPDWLTFSVELLESGGGVVPKFSDVPVQGEFDVPTSKTAIKRVNLEPWFGVSSPGRYAVTATVRIPGWDRELVSQSKSFYIIEGTRMWEQDVGIPNTGTNGIPELRKYVLQKANYLKGQPKLYLRVLDGYGKVVNVVPVGATLSFSQPEPQVDRQNRLHLMYQSGPSAFTYYFFSPDGEVLKRQTHDYYGQSRPRLRMDENGEVNVVGGVRRGTKDDVPPPVPEPVQEHLDNVLTNRPAEQAPSGR